MLRPGNRLKPAAPPPLAEIFNAIQNDSNNPTGSIGRPGEVALKLLQDTAHAVFKKSAPDITETLDLVFKVIAKNLVLEKRIRTLAKRSFDPVADDLANGIVDYLKTGATSIAEKLLSEIPALLTLGLKPEQIGTTLVRVTAAEAAEFYNDSIFFKKGKIDSTRVDLFLSSKDSRRLYQRIKDAYQTPSLSDLDFHAVLLLVQNPELAGERVRIASEQIEAGLSKHAATEYAQRDEGQRAWFNLLKDLPGFRNNHSSLLEMAKLNSSQRAAALEETHRLLNNGAGYNDAIRISYRAVKEPAVLAAFKLALMDGLNSSAAKDFAASNMRKEPQFALNQIKTLRGLGLDFSDEACVRFIVGSPREPRNQEAAGIYCREDLLKGLKDNYDHAFLINRDNAVAYQLRRVLGNLNIYKILKLYAVFFKSDEIPDLINRLHNNSAIEKITYDSALGTKNSWLGTTPPDFNTPKPDSFNTLCYNLSDFTISLNESVRFSFTSRIHSCLFSYAQKYYTQWADKFPEVVSHIIDRTILNYDPKSKAGKAKDPSIIAALGNNMKHFYSTMIRFNLRDDHEAIRAYKLFSEINTKLKKQAVSGGAAAAWASVREERPELGEAITRAEAEYNRIADLKTEEGKN